MKLLKGGPHRRFPAARLVLLLILVIAATGGLPTSSQACGIITHHNVTERAAQDPYQIYGDLAALVAAYPGEVLYGSVFPDWGYHWNVWNQWQFWAQAWHKARSDDAHTEAFLAGYVGHLKATLHSPYTEDDKKAIAFMLGLIAHYEQDEQFHPQPGDTFERFLVAARTNEYGPDVAEWLIEEDVDLYVRDAYEGYLTGNYCNGWQLPNNAKQIILAVYTDILGSSQVTEADLVAGFNCQGSVCNFEAIEPRDIHPWVDNNFLNYEHGGLLAMVGPTQGRWWRAWEALTQPNTHNKLFMPLLTRQ